MVKSAEARLDSVFHALADSTRRSILRDLARGEKTVSEVATPFPVSLAAVSKHLKVLEASNLISRKKSGSYHLLRLNARPMKDAERWLARYERFWNARLDALGKLLDDEERSSS